LYEKLAPFGLHPTDVTSVVSGPHVKGSAHFDGRAIDVGTVGGVAVGDNAPTVGFLIRAIEKGGLQKIGSTLSVINNPQVVKAAQDHGVELFEDEGTGPHMHLQVAPLSAENRAIAEAKKPHEYSPLETLFNTLDIPFYIADALVRDGKPFTNFPQAKYVLDAVMHGKVNEVAQHYNLMSPDQLKDEAMHGDGIAEYFLTHPIPAAAADAVAHFMNPAYNLVGGALGKSFKLAFEVASKSPLGRAAFNAFSPFMHLAMAAGEEGKQLAHALAQHIANAEAEAQAAALDIYKGYTKAEQNVINHLVELGGAINFSAQRARALAREGIDPAREGELRQQATKLSTLLTEIKKKKIRAGVGDASTDVSSRKIPYKGIVEDRFKNVQGEGTGHGFAPWGDDPNFKLHELQGGVAGKLDVESSHAVRLAAWLASSKRRLYLNDALQTLPKDLIRDRPAGLQAPWTNLPRDKAGQELMPWEQIIQKFPELKYIDAPVLRTSLISPSLAKFLSERSTLLFDGSANYLPETNLRNRVINNMLKSWDNLSEYNRRAIIANPIIHPAFNLAINAAAAGVPVWDVAALVGKSIVSSFGGAKLVEKWLPESAEFVRYRAEAIAAAATSELTQGDTRLLSTAWSDLNTPEKVMKVFAEVGAWNARSTFGVHGEQAFATALFQKLMKSGRYSEPEASQLVREALGNYQNITKSERDIWGRLIFFYPWLKGNMAFWVRKLTTAPQFVAAPATAARANNLLVGDPEETDSEHPSPAKDFQFIIQSADGTTQRHTPILPQRMLADPSTLMTGDPHAIIGRAWQVMESRAQPMVNVFARAMKTSLVGPASPEDPRDFDTLYSKNAPAGVQWKEIGSNVAGELAPIPLLKYVFQQYMARGTIPQAELIQKLEGAAFGDFIYTELTKPQQIALHRAMTEWTRMVKSMPPRLPNDEKQRRLLKFYQIYDKKVKNILYHTAGGDGWKTGLTR
jgi:hypothetical protein